MRSEAEVFQELLDWADASDNIRMIVLNGSHADPAHPPDALSDYDPAIFVRDLTEFSADDAWLGQFGDVMARWPRSPQPTFDPDWITQLALFTDGVRIDFQFTTIDNLLSERAGDYFCVLVDKDGLSRSLEPVPTFSRAPRSPTEDEFIDRLNAFWWDIPYVAKALKRGELTFARFMLDGTIRFDKLHPLLRWYAWTVLRRPYPAGAHDRWLHRILDDATWDRYLHTFAGPGIEDNWRAMYATIDLLRMVAKSTASHLGFDYPHRLDERMTEYLRGIERMDLSTGPDDLDEPSSRDI